MGKKSSKVISLSLVLAAVWGGQTTQSFAAVLPMHSSLFDSVSVRYNAIVLGKNFPYYTQQMRVQTMTDLVRSIQSDYSLVLYKQHTLGVDVVQLGDAAVAEEHSTPDVFDEAAQAQGNMEFLDRARKLVANFQDSHFQLDGAQPTSEVALGIGVAKISGKFVVTTTRKPLLKDQKTHKDYSAQVAIGDELVSIDGVSPEVQAQVFKPYLSASSSGFLEMLAVGAITARDFQLPQKGTADVVLHHQGSTISMSLPWYSLSTVRTDQATLFKNRGVTMINEDTLGPIEGLDKPVVLGTLFLNAQWRTTIGGLTDEQNFVDLNNLSSTVVKFGVLDAAAGPVGFLQIQSFGVDTLVDAASLIPPKPVEGKPAQAAQPKIVKFADLIKGIGAILAQNKLPLILDLRNNPGGNPEYSDDVLSALAPVKAAYAPVSMMYRVTELAWETEDASTQKGLTDPKSLSVQKALDDAFRNAISSQQPYTEVLPGDPIATDADVGGYDGKVIALTSPNCVSACDIMAILLKSTGRATLLGQPTNGTGAGFSTAFDVPSWGDTNHILSARLPNMLFGRPLLSTESAATVNVESIEAENRPTQPDVFYEQDLKDVTSGNADLIQAALKQL